MDSPYFIFGLLVLITGIFLAIAMSIQFCACVKAIRRIQREKARLREIQEAAAQPPPPYAVVVSSCHLNSTNSDCYHHQSLPHTGGNNICCIIGTISQHQGSPILSQSPSNILSLSNTGAVNVCYSCSPTDLTLSENIQCNSFHIKPSDYELPPTYEDAVKKENEVTGMTARF